MQIEDGSEFEGTFFRIIATRRPTINLYEDIVSPSKFDAIFLLEARTNPRMREERGETKFISDNEKYTGINSSLVNAPFLDFSTERPSRFSSGNFGVFYGAKEYECAVEETIYHALEFLKDSNETKFKSQKRVLSGTFKGKLYNIKNKKLPEIYSTIDYAESQKLGFEIKKNKKDGIVYDSVRYKGGTCYAIFKPCIIKSVKELKCLEYELIENKIKVTEISCN